MAEAKVRVHVKNCTSEDVTFTTYNGADGVNTSHVAKFTLKGRKPGAAEPDVRTTHCNRGCKWLQDCSKQTKHCKVGISLFNSTEEWIPPIKKMEEGQYLRLYEVKKTWKKGDRITSGKYTLSSREQACDDPVRNPQSF